MALREELEGSGNWLFRWRSYIPLPMLALFSLAAAGLVTPDRQQGASLPWEALCLVISVIGWSMRAHTMAHVPQGTSGRNTSAQAAETLNTSGTYSVVRNPLYLGSFLMWLGIALVVQVWWVAVIYVFLFWICYERIMFAEEEYLRRAFGESYLEWAKRTPVFLPRLRNYRSPDLPFSARQILRRESNSLFAVILVMAFLHALSSLAIEPRPAADQAWWMLLGVAAAGWVIVRIVRKQTKVLDVEGR